MSDFFSHLLDCAQERAPTLQRRRPSLFEPRQDAGWNASPWGGTQLPDGEDAQAQPLGFAEPQPPAASALSQPVAAQPAQAPQPSAPRQEAMSHVIRRQIDTDNRGAVGNAAPQTVAANPPALLRVVETRVEHTVERLQPINPFAAQERQVEKAAPASVAAPTSAAKPSAVPTVQVDASIGAPSGARPSQPEGDGTEGKATPPPFAPSPPQPRRAALSSPQRRQSPPERPAASAPPTIQVTIGRVEIRATAGKPAAAPTARPAAPKLSLEDYLKSRSGGGR
ncbi:hypothetical protein [Methylogaea oryzae]|uniref:Uncharacterized protein n=1 Tax=Methylogaea oryzae TaxID=1295382 RepID=A0A8D5ALG6_9GAMM|nr:hypothetical protein [Methylogaea oryzae]BBL72824.1 hypothetical protein MoryE10_34300 [Methylogaea oryzae]